MKFDSKIKRSYEITIELEWDELDRILGALDHAIDETGDNGLSDLYNGLTQAVSEKTPLVSRQGIVPR